MSNINVIVYLKDNIDIEKEKLKGFNLFKILKSLPFINDGEFVEVNPYTVAIYNTNNFVAASIKNTLSNKLFKVETFVEHHPKLK